MEDNMEFQKKDNMEFQKKDNMKLTKKKEGREGVWRHYTFVEKKDGTLKEAAPHRVLRRPYNQIVTDCAPHSLVGAFEVHIRVADNKKILLEPFDRSIHLSVQEAVNRFSMGRKGDMAAPSIGEIIEGGGLLTEADCPYTGPEDDVYEDAPADPFLVPDYLYHDAREFFAADEDDQKENKNKKRYRGIQRSFRYNPRDYHMFSFLLRYLEQFGSFSILYEILDANDEVMFDGKGSLKHCVIVTGVKDERWCEKDKCWKGTWEYLNSRGKEWGVNKNGKGEISFNRVFSCIVHALHIEDVVPYARFPLDLVKEQIALKKAAAAAI